MRESLPAPPSNPPPLKLSERKKNMKLTELEEAHIMREIRTLFAEQESTPGFVVETRTDIEFGGGITLGLSIQKSDTSEA